MPSYSFALKQGKVSAKNTAVAAGKLASGGQQDVRRPMRGIQVKRETFASMTVLNTSGDVIPLVNSSAAAAEAGGVAYSDYSANFILTGSSTERSEKFQSSTTFGASFGFFFGEQPRFETYQAVLLNTADFQWELEWWTNYENVLRGTKLVDNAARVYLYYDEVTVEGYILSARTQKNAMQPYEVALTFTMWVTNVTYSEIAGMTMDARVDSGDPTEVEGVTSTTEAVRAANIDAFQKRGETGGLLGALRSGLLAVQNFTGEVGAAVNDAKNFLYGRSLVIPAGFAGSERYSGAATFAAGSLTQSQSMQVSGLLSSLTGGSVTIQLPAPRVIPVRRPLTQYHDNMDEYVNREGERLFPRLPASEMGDTREARQKAAVLAAEGMFAANGYDVTNQLGSESSILKDFMGRAMFGVVSLVGAEASTTLNASASAQEDAERRARVAGEQATQVGG